MLLHVIMLENPLLSRNEGLVLIEEGVKVLIYLILDQILIFPSLEKINGCKT